MLKSPIAYIVFNRPRHTRKTFEVIRSQRPTKLFIIADGPRSSNELDNLLCTEVRKILENIDWPCEVQRNYSNINLGCKNRVISGLDWVFNQVESAIILEDDCLPHADFFLFCETLLQKYQTEEKIYVITGNNFQNGNKFGDASYYFSKYNHVWGWATWKRAWLKNNSNLTFWPAWKDQKSWKTINPDPVESRYWSNIFNLMKRNAIDTWDYPWVASVWYQGGLTATPNVNLVTNIGFGPDGTHTISVTDQEGIATASLGPLTHPNKIKQNLEADRYVFDHEYDGLNQRWPAKLKRLSIRLWGFAFKRFTKNLG